MQIYSKTTKDNYAKIEVVDDNGVFFVNVYENIDGKWTGVDNDPAKFDAVEDALYVARSWFYHYNADTRNRALSRR